MPLPSYTLKRNSRSRGIRIRVLSDGVCVVTAPKRVPMWMIRKIVEGKTAWIEEHVEEAKKKPRNLLQLGSKAEYLKLKDEVLRLVEKRLDHFNKFYKLSYKKVSIRNQKTRWGSCTSTGTLSFNYRIIHLPPEAQDYIIVHELCHLAQMNHSIKFWRLVEKAIPDHRKIRATIRNAK